MKISKSYLFALVFAALGFLYVQYEAELPRDELRAMLGKNKYPLKGKTAVVTGSTSGLGMAIATELYGFGAQVYVVGRSPDKLARVAAAIRETGQGTPGSIQTEILDTSDLESVKNFAEGLMAVFGDDNHIDYLVNNAGIHHVSSGDAALVPSKQEFDMAFATNYLGHFLLTELLLPSMADNGRIVQVSSTMHMMSDATMLRTMTSEEAPLAAQHLPDDSWHQAAAYGNNKLAQVLHARELQRQLVRKGSGIKVLSICPNWVNTGILPDDIGGRFVASQAFSPTAGSLSALYALFSPQLKGGEYVGNSRILIMEVPGLISGLLAVARGTPRARLAMIGGLSMVVLAVQKFMYGATVSESSPESYDKGLQRSLYLWSKNAVSDFL